MLMAIQPPPSIIIQTAQGKTFAHNNKKIICAVKENIRNRAGG
jgi:hypothetical protein